jgi:hypothetical protein
MIAWNDLIINTSDEKNRTFDFTDSVNCGVKYPLNEFFEHSDKWHKLVNHIGN